MRRPAARPAARSAARLAALVLAVLAGGPALSQEERVEADLDGDGAAEIYRLDFEGAKTSTEMMFVDLVVTAGASPRRVEHIAWSGGHEGSQPGLELGPAGEVLLTSGNGAYGRDRWYETVTIAHFDGDWRVAALRYTRQDVLDLDDWARCDLDLRTGRGLVATPSGDREVATPDPSPIWTWRAGSFDPMESCGFD